MDLFKEGTETLPSICTLHFLPISPKMFPWSFKRVAAIWRKENIQDFEDLLNTGSEVKIISKDAKNYGGS